MVDGMLVSERERACGCVWVWVCGCGCGCRCGCGCGCVHRVRGRFAMIVNGERRALIDVQVLRQGMRYIQWCGWSKCGVDVKVLKM